MRMPEYKKVIRVFVILFFGFFNWTGANIVPGRSCGTDTPIKFVDKLKKDTKVKDLECVIVKDPKSYQKFYRAAAVLGLRLKCFETM